MTGVSKDWLVVIVFFVGFFVFTTLETMWIARRTSAGFPRSLFVSFSSNVFAITVGYFVSFLIMGVVFAVVWDESIDQIPSPNAFLWAAVSAAIIFPILLSALIRRLLLKVAKLDAIPLPWSYSFAVAIIFNIGVIIIPALFAYFF
jgi:magnesium-transporting ATPase (P-type)